MPKDNRSRQYSHYSHPRGRDERDRSPRDRDRDRSPHDRRDRDYDRERQYDRERGYHSYRDSPPRRGYPGHPYSSSYPQQGSSYMSDQRRTGFARGRGSDQQRRTQQYGGPREGGGEAPQLPKFGPGTGASFQSSGARGSPQPGYGRSQESGPSFPGAAGGRARTRDEAAGEETVREQGSGGRGNWRGGRILPAELLVTRDKELKNKKGTSGQVVTLQANFFKLLSSPTWGLFQYDVKFEPNEERTVIRKGMVRSKADVLKAYIFDGSILYSHEKYPENFEFTVKRSIDDTPIRITITFTKEVSKSDYQYLQFFNIIMRKCYELLQLQLVGRNYFDPNNKVAIPQHQLELWPGYASSIRQFEYDILMSAEITHKVMRQQTLLDILNETYQYQKHDFKAAYASQVVGLVALTDYNNNTYRIDDIDWEVTPMSTFTMKDKSVITYKEYYKKRYQIDIRQENQPMLVTQTKPKDKRAGGGDLVYLVPELCRATGITERMKSNRPLMSALAEHTRVNPKSRIEKLLQFNQRLYSVPEITAEFTRWNLQLDKKLVEVPARILEDEIIYIGKGKSVKGENADWTKGLRSNEMFVQTDLLDWFIIYPRGKGRDIATFITNFTRVGNGFRLRIEPPQQIELNYDNSSDYTQEIEGIMSRCNPQLIMCITANNRSDKYSAIKKKCAVDRPVPSQVLLLKNTTKGMSIATKVAVQVNCKLGGAPWTVNIPLDGFMVVGFDVCHDTNSKNRDFGAMVASMDKYCTRYYSTVSAHSNGQELSDHFAMNVVKALRKYKELHGANPTRIMIYRDGVGEGDIAYVMQHEVAAIKKALTEAYGNPDLVKFAFILVNKRVNARFFYNKNNPPPGTIVDDVITNPLKFDFYLVSQYVTQGTVSPTAYSVLHSTCGLAPDKIQRLTYKLTHIYYNWCGTVRVPAPCQYAHKLAFLVAQSIHKAPDGALESILHFL